MKKCQHERGYTLFLVVLTLTLFGILTVSLLTITFGGMTKSATREDVTQAAELSEKGLQRFIQELQLELTNILEEANNEITADDFTNQMKQVFLKYDCESGEEYTGTGETGNYTVCISEILDTEVPTVKDVVMTGTGTADGKDVQLNETVRLGAGSAPAPLKYAINAYQSEQCNDCTHEGNLFLHGGVDVIGDIKVDGNLVVAEHAFTPARGEDFLIKNAYWLESTLPSTINSHIKLSGDIYKYNIPNYNTNNRRIEKYKEHVQTPDFYKNYYEQKDKVSDVFFNEALSPSLDIKTPERSEVDIASKKDDFYYHYNDPGVKRINSGYFELFEGHRTYKNLQKPDEKLYAYYCAEGLIYECVFNIKPKYNGKFYLVGHNDVGQFAVKQDLHIGREIIDDSISATFRNGLYVGRHLIIGRGVYSNLEAATNTKKTKVDIKGNIFVDGDLTIRGVNGVFESVIYVNGDVTIESSIFNEKSKLIIFANGKINIIKNGLFQSKKSHLHAFFYSNEGIDIYGSATNLKITGGLSAPYVSLNAIRGRAGTGGLAGVIKPFDPSQHHQASYYETKANQVDQNGDPKESRLVIEYDTDLLEKYSDLISDNLVHHVIEPVILDREMK